MLNRRFLDEIAIVCKKEQVGLLPYSPLAGGVLSGKYAPGGQWDGFRFGDYLANPDPRMKAQAGRFANDRSVAAAQKYAAIAKQYGLAPATMAAAWTLSFDFVPSTIVGATHPSQLDDTLKACGNSALARAFRGVQQGQSRDSLPDGVSRVESTARTHRSRHLKIHSKP